MNPHDRHDLDEARQHLADLDTFFSECERTERAAPHALLTRVNELRPLVAAARASLGGGPPQSMTKGPS